jgi:multidrug efflux pump subunit AcrA (membrane-fusion protein)
MTTAKRDIVRVRHILSIALTASMAAACGGGDGASRAAPVTTASGPVAIDVVRVVEQSLDVPLSLPGELTAFQSVAMFPRVTGFVKAVNVDRGSKVRTGDLLVSLEAAELVAQRSEAQSKSAGSHQHRLDNGPYICDPYQERENRVDRREDGAHLGRVG